MTSTHDEWGEVVEPVRIATSATPVAEVDIEGVVASLIAAIPSMAWRERARCRGGPATLDDWFPEKRFRRNSNEYKDHIAYLKGVCATCPVRVDCLDFAQRLKLADGVFGGHTSEERRKLRRDAAQGEPGDQALP